MPLTGNEVATASLDLVPLEAKFYPKFMPGELERVVFHSIEITKDFIEKYGLDDGLAHSLRGAMATGYAVALAEAKRDAANK